MRILFDQGVPVPLRRYLGDHSIDTAYEKGWSRLSNGDLLDAAEQAGYELLITTDQNLPYQQNLGRKNLAILALPTTSWPRILSLIEDVRAAVDQIAPGDYRQLPA